MVYSTKRNQPTQSEAVSLCACAVIHTTHLPVLYEFLTGRRTPTYEYLLSVCEFALMYVNAWAWRTPPDQSSLFAWQICVLAPCCSIAKRVL